LSTRRFAVPAALAQGDFRSLNSWRVVVLHVRPRNALTACRQSTRASGYPARGPDRESANRSPRSPRDKFGNTARLADRDGTCDLSDPSVPKRSRTQGESRQTRFYGASSRSRPSERERLRRLHLLNFTGLPAGQPDYPATPAGVMALSRSAYLSSARRRRFPQATGDRHRLSKEIEPSPLARYTAAAVSTIGLPS